MRHAIVRQVEIAADWWESMTPAQKKQYIKDHPNSKYAKEAIKDAAPKRARGTNLLKGRQERMAGKMKDPHAAAKKAKDDYAAHSKENKELFGEYNTLLKQLNASKPGSAKEKELDAKLSKLEKHPAIKKGFALKDAQKEAENLAKNAPKPAAKAPAKKGTSKESHLQALKELVKTATGADKKFLKQKIEDLQEEITGTPGKSARPAAPVKIDRYANPKDPAPSKPEVKTEGLKIAPEVKKKLTDTAMRVTHYDGNGTKMPMTVGSAASQIIDGKPSIDAIITMVSTNNYGGPVASYRHGLAKSYQDPEVIQAIKDATAAAKKLAPRVVKQATDELVGEVKTLAKKFNNEKTYDKLREALTKRSYAKESIDNIVRDIKDKLDNSIPAYGVNGSLRYLSEIDPDLLPSLNKNADKAWAVAYANRKLERR